MDCATMAEAAAAALAEAIGADAFDLLPGNDGAFVDIAADEWSLRIEGSPVSMAWLSIDDEPEQPEALPAARRAVMPAAVDHALHLADRHLGGELLAALRASGDPLTLDLAEAVNKAES